MNGLWESGDPYEYFMGRWSGLVAALFIDWLSPSSGLRWLDVGCGSGALSETVIKDHEPAEVTAIDRSEGFVVTARKRLGNHAHCMVGDALALPLRDFSVDFTVSGLVLNFISEPEKALAEMRRVTSPGGTVAIYVWDYAGKMDFLNHFWDVAVEIDPEASGLHEGRRYPDAGANALKDLFAKSGFTKTSTIPLEIRTDFIDFDDYWKPFLGNQGPAPMYVASLDEKEKSNLRDALRKRLPIQPDGTIPMVARAWTAAGRV